jgi:hypothetical protein
MLLFKYFFKCVDEFLEKRSRKFYMAFGFFFFSMRRLANLCQNRAKYMEQVKDETLLCR